MLVITGYVVLAESVSAQGMWRSFMALATEITLQQLDQRFRPEANKVHKKKKEVKDNAGNSLRVFSLELAEVFA